MTYKIMIVDDQFVSREMFRLNINQCPDYEVVYSVDTAMFADTYVLNKKIDLVIMDILMNDGSNGLDAAEKIKKLKPEIKIIAVTSMPEVSWMNRAKEIGIDSFWYKEISKEEILEIKEKFADDRRTKIVPDEGEFDIEELIEKEDVLISLTHDGYIKRLPINTYKVQNRGGKGISAGNTKENDFIQKILTTNTHESLLCFTNLGRVYSLKCYEIPEASRQSRGQAIINIISLATNEKITDIMELSELSDNSQLVFQTEKGKIKKTDAQLFTNIQRNGIIAISLEDDDRLVSIRQIDHPCDIIVTTQKGMAIKFASSDIRSMGRNAQGVRAIRLGDDDKVVSMNIVEDEVYLVVVTANGFGKKTSFNNFNNQNRGGKGVRCHKITEKTGNVVATLPANLDDDIMMVSLKGDMIRISARDISTTGRNTLGVKLKNLENTEDYIVSVTKYYEENSED